MLLAHSLLWMSYVEASHVFLVAMTDQWIKSPVCSFKPRLQYTWMTYT